MVGETAVGVVLETAVKPPRAALHVRILVNLVTAPAAAAPIEQAHQTVRVGVAVAQEAAEVVGDARYRPAGGAREALRPERENLGAQRRAHALVGVEAQHPVVARRIDGELLLRAVTGPVALDDPRPEGGGEFARAVGGMGV